MKDRKIIGCYLNNFRRLFTPMMKSGVGLNVTVYQFEGGALLVGELGFGLNTKDEYKKEVSSLREAMVRTGLFVDGVEDKGVSGTAIVLSRNYIIIVKDDKPLQWEESMAEQDVQQVLSIIRQKLREDGRS